MTFRVAILCSAVLHTVLMASRPPTGWTPPKGALKSLEVFYTPPPRPTVRPRSVSMGKPEPAPAPRRSGNSADLPPTGMERPIPVAVRPAYPSVPSKQSPASARPPSVTPSVVPSGAQAISDEEFAAIQHKEQVRLHLKARLSYPDRVGEGVVRLRVVLGPEGRLLKAEGLEASDPRLMNQVVQDAESAAPYPVFPARLRHRQVTYEFLVRYQPE